MVIIPSISLPAPLTLAPRLGNMLGGTALLVSGPCLEVTDQITCEFGETAVTGVYISQMLSLCITPPFNTIGRIRFQLTVRADGSPTIRYQGESIFYSGIEVANVIYSTVMLIVNWDNPFSLWNLPTISDCIACCS